MSERQMAGVSCKTALLDLRETIAAQMKQIPLQKGIFVGKEDRAKACMAACGLLMQSESKIAALRRALSSLSSSGCAELCEKLFVSRET